MKPAWISVLVLALLVFLPDVAHACAVCFDARDENRQAFVATTAFLSLLPLGMVAGAGLWVRRRSREIDEKIDSEAPSDR
jgi:hypothetical protein